MDSSWEHILVSLIAAIPATVAAVSSVRNGHAIKNGHAQKRRSAKADGSNAMESGELQKGSAVTSAWFDQNGP